jgi:dihydrofolate reductase
MIVSLIVAIGKSRQIGKGNQMLWHVKEDFKKFKETTMGHHLIMGRKTFESIGRPLPGRTTIIITTNTEYQAPEGVLIASSPEMALEMARSAGEGEAFIAGGGIIYDLFLERSNRLYLSKIDFDGEADVFFPKYDGFKWSKITEQKYSKTEKSPEWTFQLLEK